MAFNPPMMFTVGYRRHWIHCSVRGNKTTCRIQAPNLKTVGTSKSVEGAKKKIRARTQKKR